MHATMNTFPPFQSMNSPRGYVLAAIVLLHGGFFWLLSSSMGHTLITTLRGSATYVVVPPETQPKPPEPKPVIPPIDVVTATVIQSVPPAPVAIVIDDPVVEPTNSLRSQSEAGHRTGSTTPPAPVIVLPEIDPRVGLTEPTYPASEIRMEHTGTVMLSVWVLENGRVGDVRLDQSSGWRKLDESALREARRWHFTPGMRDGVAIGMWKQIPVTFQLQTDNRRN